MPGTYPSTPPAGDWRQQVRALAIESVPSGPEAASPSVDQARSHLLMMGVLVVAIAVGMGLYLAGVGPTIAVSETGPDIPLSIVPVVVIVVVMAGRSLSGLSRAAAGGGDGERWLASLGLQTEAVPQVAFHPTSTPVGDRHRVEGVSVVGGRRHGRRVEIVMDGTRYQTSVRGTYPEFRVETRKSRLVASDDAPQAVRQVVSALSGKRWEGVELVAGSDGIRVHRKYRGSQIGDVLWLSDLWLAECIADRLART